MTRATVLDEKAQSSVLRWAEQRHTELVLSLSAADGWHTLRSRLLRCDPAEGLFEIAYPDYARAGAEAAVPRPGDELGVSFRRGHKKCIFMAKVVVWQTADACRPGPVGQDAAILRLIGPLRELQRRAYQRVVIPQDRFIAVRVREGGLPVSNEASWVLCAGRLSNISAGGVLIEIRADQNPNLSVGDLVAVEITTEEHRKPLMLEAQYRHCCLEGADRLGLGFQFVGLERESPGCTTLSQLADLVRQLQRNGAHGVALQPQEVR